MQKLVASDKEAEDFFGGSVAISGDYAIVGAFNEDGIPGTSYLDGSGAAYIFFNDTSKVEIKERVSK